MAVRYVNYYGKKLSRRWNVVLREADRQNVRFHLTSGRRSVREQWRLFRQNMRWNGWKWVPKPGRPLTAYPSPNAPHIRVGRAHHALDVSSLDGGETRLERWIESEGANWVNTVRSESWHGEVSGGDLRRLARKIRRRNRRKR